LQPAGKTSQTSKMPHEALSCMESWFMDKGKIWPLEIVQTKTAVHYGPKKINCGFLDNISKTYERFIAKILFFFDGVRAWLHWLFLNYTLMYCPTTFWQPF
jgi:hypothetical protein